MRRLEVMNAEVVKSLLRAEVKGSSQSGFAHRLHCVALVCAGFGCNQIAAAFGDDPRSVQRWVGRFRRLGVDGLADKPRSGRPVKLAESQVRQLRLAVTTASTEAVAAWTAQRLQTEILRRFGVSYSERHCARLLDRLLHAAEDDARAGVATAAAEPMASKAAA